MGDTRSPRHPMTDHEHSSRLIEELRQELEDTNRGLIALHTELEAARHAEARLAAIVTSSDDAMISLDSAHLVQAWNPGARRLLGHEHAGVAGRPIETLMPAEAAGAFEAAVEQIRSAGHAEPYESRWVRADGTLVDVAVTVSAMHDSDGAQIGFTTVARDITHQLAAQAELAAARADRQVMAERDRIARDLHDMVIQRVFAAGLELQGVAPRISRPEVAARLRAVIDELDATIRDLRNTIFDLHQPAQRAASLRAEIIELADTARGRLGFAPTIEFEGPVDAAVPDETAVHVLAVLREALSNVVRHARASAVEVAVRAGTDLLVEVIDNGRGLGETTRRSGLANLRHRAEDLGGTCEVTSRLGAGTRISWRIPLPAPGPSS